MADVDKILQSEKLQSLKLHTPLYVGTKSPLKVVLQQMREKNRGYAVIVEEQDLHKIAGIFTERDILRKVIPANVSSSTPIEELMTPNPKVLKMEDSVADAIQLMSHGGYRHVPLVDSQGQAQGILSARNLILYLAEHFPFEIYNLPPDPHQVMKAPEGA